MSYCYYQPYLYFLILSQSSIHYSMGHKYPKSRDENLRRHILIVDGFFPWKEVDRTLQDGLEKSRPELERGSGLGPCRTKACQRRPVNPATALRFIR